MRGPVEAAMTMDVARTRRTKSFGDQAADDSIGVRDGVHGGIRRIGSVGKLGGDDRRELSATRNGHLIGITNNTAGKPGAG